MSRRPKGWTIERVPEPRNFMILGEDPKIVKPVEEDQEFQLWCLPVKLQCQCAICGATLAYNVVSSIEGKVAIMPCDCVPLKEK